MATPAVKAYFGEQTTADFSGNLYHQLYQFTPACIGWCLSASQHLPKFGGASLSVNLTTFWMVHLPTKTGSAFLDKPPLSLRQTGWNFIEPSVHLDLLKGTPKKIYIIVQRFVSQMKLQRKNMFTYQVPDPYQTFSLQILELSRGNRIAPTIERNIPFPSHVGLPEIEPDPRHPGCISCIKLHQLHSSFVSSSIQSKENTIKYHSQRIHGAGIFTYIDP